MKKPKKKQLKKLTNIVALKAGDKQCRLVSVKRGTTTTNDFKLANGRLALIHTVLAERVPMTALHPSIQII